MQLLFYCLVVFICSFDCLYNSSGVVSITIDNGVANKQKKRMPLFIGILDARGADVDRLAPFLKADLELSGQFKVTIERQDLPQSQKEIKELYTKGYLLALFINKAKDGNSFEWRLYNTASATLEKGKRCPKQGNQAENWAHLLSHVLWQELMGSVGPFTTRLSYIKRKPTSRLAFDSELCISDLQGKKVRSLFSTPRISVAPYWASTKDTQNGEMQGNFNQPSLIYFSEFTDANVRLVSATTNGKKRVVLDLDGTTAGISFQPATGDIVYGRSGGIWHCYYDPLLKKSIHTLLIKEKDVCASPSILSNGDVIYCSQGKVKRYNRKTGKRENIVDEGYTVGPALHEKTGQLVYSCRVKLKQGKSYMQLFIHPISGGKGTQLTFDEGDKTDPCWSPCGTWVAFGVEAQSKSRIALLNIKTRKFFYLTPHSQDCRYPAWSPLFALLDRL